MKQKKWYVIVEGESSYLFGIYKSKEDAEETARTLREQYEGYNSDKVVVLSREVPA